MVQYKDYNIPSTKDEIYESDIKMNNMIPSINHRLSNGSTINTNISIAEFCNANEDQSKILIEKYINTVKIFIDAIE